MTLNNQNLMVMSKFALIARKHIGLVKVAEMYSNEEYACNVMAKATLSNDQELVNFTKLISHELNIGITLINSIESYINKIKTKNFNEKFIHATKFFLPRLTEHLHGIEIKGASYREAVEKFLINVDAKDRTFCVNLAREFYLTWRSANNPTSLTDKDQTIKLMAKKEAFIKKWDNIDLEILTNEENLVLSLYTESMRKRGLILNDIIISQKIAKVIILELRVDYSTTDLSFRNAIDRALELFERLDLKTFFLTVSREFYHFWVVDGHMLENEADIYPIISNAPENMNYLLSSPSLTPHPRRSITNAIQHLI
jgi:hypothetical protein